MTSQSHLYSTVGLVSRWVLAGAAIVSLAQLLLLISVGTEHAEYLAGKALVRTILFGAIAGWWFYRARKLAQREQTSQATMSPLPLKTETTPEASSSNAPTENTSKGADSKSPTANYVVIGGVIFLIFGLLVASLYRTNDVTSQHVETPTVTNPVDQSLGSKETPAASGMDVWKQAGEKGKKGQAQPSCPSAIPAGVSSRILSGDETKLVVGTKASLDSSSDATPDGMVNVWVAELHFSNGTQNCITSAEVEMSFQQGESSFKERHTVPFKPLLPTDSTTYENVTLRRRTAEHAEPLGIQEWHVIRVWGFPAISDAAK